MNMHLSICCLLVSLNFASFVDCDITKSNTTSNDVANEVTEINNEDNRWELEIEDFPTGLRIENEKGELVELTAEKTAPPGSASRKISDSVVFELYTKENPVIPQSLGVNRYALEDIQASNFDAAKPTVFITHGWISNGATSACTLIRDAYLKAVDVNVFVVDWGSIALSSYYWAAQEVVRVGKQVADMINFLQKNKLLTPRRTTLIGHSLGAHIMGIAGHNTEGVIHSIFGLDPAYPLFKYANPGSRISHYDAANVQIIHTNAGLLGYPEAVGHADFYPNGGSSQLGCVFDIGGSCSHSRAFELFAESVTMPNAFVGRRCASSIDFLLHHCNTRPFAPMGGLTPNPRLRGIFYLWTNPKPPYAVGF